MPWNEPGENGNKNSNDPWRGKNSSGPPDLDKVVKDFINKVVRAFSFKKSGNTSSGWQTPTEPHKGHHYGFVITASVLFVLWFLSGFFLVNPAEETVVLRFGKYSEVLTPGLHWIARFIESKYTVDVQKIYSFSLQGDFLTKSSDQNDFPAPQDDVSKKIAAETSPDQSKNLVNVELNVQYRINNPRAYLFNVVSPDETVQQVAAGALSDAVGKMKLDDVLTTGRELLSSTVLERTKKVLMTYNAGVDVVAVNLRKVQAPDQVRMAFNDVNRADQDRSTTIQQAQAYASKVVPLAQGSAARILADATAYQQQVVLTAQANIAKYQALLKVYANSPNITKERMYLETMQTIFSHTTKILVDFNNSNNMLYLPLDKLMKQAKNSNPDEASPMMSQAMQNTVGSTDTTQTNVGVRNDAN